MNNQTELARLNRSFNIGMLFVFGQFSLLDARKEIGVSTGGYFRLPMGTRIDSDWFWKPPGEEGWLQAFLWSGSESEVEELLQQLNQVPTKAP